MSEVTKRDAQSKVISKYAAYAEKLDDSTTIADIAVRKRELDAAWTRYQILHEHVLERAGSSELSEQDQLADNVREMYLSASVQYCKYLDRLQTHVGTQSTPEKPCVATSPSPPRRHAIARLIMNMEHKAAERIASMAPAAATPQLQALKDLHGQYQAAVVDAISTASDIVAGEIIDEQADISDAYLRTVALLQSAIDRVAHSEQSDTAQPNHHGELKVPAVQIGTFDGTTSKWESFRESFEQVFHLRQSMPAVQKLQHLKACLRGEAEELVANFSLTNENYEAAWSLIKQRYDNPYELARAHMSNLMKMPACKESAVDLRRLANRTSSSLLALSNLKRPVHFWDDWIVYLVTERLDPESRIMWEQDNCSGVEFPKWTDLERFLVNRVRALSAVGGKTSPSHSISATSTAQRKVRSHAVTGPHQPAKSAVCPSCNDQHAIFMCHAFRQMNPNDRRELVANKRLCFICLSSSHLATNCRSDKLCRFCNQQHNSLLHLDMGNSSERQVIANNSMIGLDPSTVLLATAIVQVSASNGELHELRAFFDNGSQSSFISEHAVQLLNLPRRSADFDMTGVDESSCGRATQAVTIIVKSRFNAFTMSIDALVLRRVTRPCALPSNMNPTWPHLRGLQLADPEYQHPKRIDILIGAESYGWSLLPDIRKAMVDAPVAQKTEFGWVISGSTKVPPPVARSNITSVNFAHVNDRIDECLERFWHVEDVESSRAKTVDEERCDTYFQETFQRDSTGRFHVRIPFRSQQPVLGESLTMAVKRMHQMERKFRSSTTFAGEYRKFMAQYHELGHMKLIGDITHVDVHQKPHYYIPHHAVLKESSSTTKLRVVFDASRRSSNGLSLNEQMLSGPRLQDDLSTIVMRWRKHRVVFTADVERMYRQIIVDEPDADLQRIVWRANDDQPMQIFKLTTVTYGTTSAPYLAVKALQTLAAIERERLPVGANIASHDFYVDDVLTGFDDIEMAMRGQAELRQLMQSGGFVLKKWTSNCSELLDGLPDGYCECRIPLELNLDQHVKTLGIQWNPVTDQFTFMTAFTTEEERSTKRQFLSDAARLYDPLGWLAPSVIVVKIMFQQLWQCNIDWDDMLPDPLAEQWRELRRSFDAVRHIQIERWVGTTSSSTVQLHGFCDSSVKAYAACIYVRTSSSDGCSRVQLLCAKTKVAPLKVISLPRLELCGAVLLCRLMHLAVTSMQFTQPTTHCWTDSTIVLSWINSSPTRWSVFVANRVAEIQRQFPRQHWQHVSSEYNPADCASRGVHPSQLPSHALWWTGPSWLSQSSQNWPSQSDISETSEEIRKKTVVHSTTLDTSWNLKEKYSSWHRLVRITAYCIRFARNARPCEGRLIGPLMPDELNAAKIVWMKDAQQLHFASELRCLRQDKPIDRSSALRSLNPTLHADGLLRVGGRLVNALVMPEQARTPIIIPRRCTLADLLVHHAHEHTLHGGPSLMLAHLRRNVWLIDGPKHVRQFVKKCNKCFRYASTAGHQMMGALPAARITPSRPFSHTAMDYSGAVMLRTSKGRGHHATKGYISVFVCLSTKAIHIEVVSDLTSAAFIAAYKRFTGRRGICSDLYSDNATNYVGAAAIFSKSERDLGFNNEVIASLAMMGTTWHFSPPLAPHFNGLAESAIRSVKHHVRRIIGDTTLTFEELNTFLIQVECCLNSRPLYPLSSDATDFSALTPAHFLIGSALNTIPERCLLNAKPNALTRWQNVQLMVQRFWAQWSTEYLHTLQQRKKWQTTQPNFKVNDMVIITDDNHPPSAWRLGRIMEVHPGQDGNVRVVTVRTATQTMKRSIVKLARLPNQDDNTERDNGHSN